MGQSILFIEDHKDTLKLFSRVLRGMGYSVVTGTTVAEAERLVNNQQYDILITDIGLPDGNGHDIIEMMGKSNPSTKCIAITGFGQSEDVKKSATLGARHITKPLTFDTLLKTLQGL
jgi:DNA-binding NtrC family response regulator